MACPPIRRSAYAHNARVSLKVILMPPSTARLGERKFETSQGGNLKFINKTICINSTENTGLDAYCHGIKLFTNCNPSKLSVMIARSEWMLGLKNSLFLIECSLISIKSRIADEIGWHFRTFSIYVNVSAVRRCAIQARLFDRKAHTGMQPLKAFQYRICCLNAAQTKETKNEFASTEEIASSGSHHKDVLLSGRFLFSFENISYSGKYLTLRVTDGTSERHNAILCWIFLHGLLGDQIKQL